MPLFAMPLCLLLKYRLRQLIISPRNFTFSLSLSEITIIVCLKIRVYNINPKMAQNSSSSSHAGIRTNDVLHRLVQVRNGITDPLTRKIAITLGVI